ncbi:MAG TPA: hypothetical protein VIP57_16550 [Candidatus Dormibacteraeota bacterium]|jgi:hypothetical protein
MVKSFFRRLRRQPIVAAVRAWFSEQFTTAPEDDYMRFSTGTAELERPPTVSVAPATFERQFMKLHAQGRFEEMWEMLAEDAQRAWGGREAFIRDMPRLDAETELLDMQVVSVAVVEGWTDQLHRRTYSNVARMVMRYRVRQQWREWTFDRQVHLIPAAGSWRTLVYPMGNKLVAT